MAENGSLVTVSGAALSLLLYENVRCLGDQVGFLLGEVVVYVTKNVTDSDRQVENIQTHVDISTIITCPLANWFYNGVGQVDKEKLKEFLRDKSKQIVGWYRFKKNDSLVPTLQDKILHKELSSALFNSNSKNHQFFTTCLLNTSVSKRGGTHKFRHVFLQYKNKCFEPVSLRINNLGDDSSRPDGSDYKPTPLQRTLSEPDAFTKIVNSLNLDLFGTLGTELVTSIQEAAENELDNMIPKLTASDREVASLERQVRQMQGKILGRRLMNKSGLEEPSYVVKLNLQKEKNDNERERKKEEAKISSIRLKNELIDIFNDESSTVENPPATIQRQASYSNKVRNLGIQSQKSVNVSPKNVIQVDLETSKPNTSSVKDPFAAVVAVMKLDITENSPKRDRRSQSKESSSSPEIVCDLRSSHNESFPPGGVERGNTRGIADRSDSLDPNLGSKKARRGRSRNTSDIFSSTSQSGEHEKPKGIVKLEFPVNTLSYSQAARKSSDSNPLKSPNSQKY